MTEVGTNAHTSKLDYNHSCPTITMRNTLLFFKWNYFILEGLIMVNGLPFHCRPNNLYTVYCNDEISVWLSGLAKKLFSTAVNEWKRGENFWKECYTDHDFFLKNSNWDLFKALLKMFFLFWNTMVAFQNCYKHAVLQSWLFACKVKNLNYFQQ